MTPWIVGNWKMNTLADSAESLVAGVRAGLPETADVDVAVCPPYPFLSSVVAAARGSALGVGAQTCHHATSGAFTGAVSAAMVRSVGVTFTLVGHSERRSLFGEDDAAVRKNLDAALEAGLGVILCVGESLEQREARRHEAVVTEQVKAALEGLDQAALGRVTVAYEPVWAIGTGRTATPAQAAAMHAVIRKVVGELHGDETAAALRILYGGSVKPANAGELLSQDEINGALVGGASLKAEDFLAIVKAALEAHGA